MDLRTMTIHSRRLVAQTDAFQGRKHPHAQTGGRTGAVGPFPGDHDIIVAQRIPILRLAELVGHWPSSKKRMFRATCKGTSIGGTVHRYEIQTVLPQGDGSRDMPEQ